VRVLPHVKKLDDCFGDFLVRVTCSCGASRHIEPEALARIAGRSSHRGCAARGKSRINNPEILLAGPPGSPNKATAKVREAVAKVARGGDHEARQSRRLPGSGSGWSGRHRRRGGSCRAPDHRARQAGSRRYSSSMTNSWRALWQSDDGRRRLRECWSGRRSERGRFLDVAHLPRKRDDRPGGTGAQATAARLGRRGGKCANRYLARWPETHGAHPAPAAFSASPLHIRFQSPV
jgi:hypothetical protein